LRGILYEARVAGSRRNAHRKWGPVPPVFHQDAYSDACTN